MNFELLNTLLNEFENNESFSYSDSTFGQICKSLSIGKISYKVIHENNIINEAVLLESDTPINPTSPIIEEKTNSVSDKVIIEFYNLADFDKYSDEELDKFNVFKKLVIQTILIRYETKLNFRLVYTDASLGVYNLNYFNIVVNQTAKYDSDSFLVGRINIKGCGKLNRLLGPAAASMFIKAYAKKLNGSIHEEEGELLSTLGGDNFAVIIKESNFEEFKKHLSGCPVEIYANGDIIKETISARAGFCKCDLSQYSSHIFLSLASETMAYAKLPNTPDISFYSEATHKITADKKKYADQIKDALENDKFLVYFQPVVEYSDTPQIVAAEALIRWNNNCQIVNPLSFIPVAEEAGLIARIDFYVLNKVCMKIREFIDSGLAVVPISCNFSKFGLMNPNFINDVISIIDNYGIDHRLVNIEFDESAFHENTELFCNTVNQLRQMGIKVVVDKFGSNIASLHLLSTLDFDFLKLDISITNDRNLKNKILIESIVQTASKLGITVICEGVESDEYVTDLNKLGCSYYQTKLYDKALTENFFINRLKNPIY